MLLTAELGVVVLVFAYLLLFVRSKLHRKPVPAANEDDEPVKQKDKPEAPAVQAGPLPVFAFEKARDIPVQGSELHYLPPFAPADHAEDVWCRLQSFTSAEPIMVRIGVSDSTPLFKSAFSPDGIVHSTGAMFREQFAAALLRQSWASLCRQVRSLSSFSVPADTPEGQYAIYTGPLFVELRGVKLSNRSFRIRARFTPNLRLIPRHFANSADYIHCPAPTGDNGGGMPVGFPWSLDSLVLYSEDRHLADGLPDFVTSLKTNHGKHLQPQTNPKETLYSDGIVMIRVTEGTAKSSTDPSLEVVYAPVPNGPLDEFAGADQEFLSFANTVKERTAPVTASPVGPVLAPEIM